MGPALGGRVGAHLARSALRAGTAWQGLVSCAGSKKIEKEMGRRRGRTDTCSPLPTPYPGSREQTVLWSPQGTFESKPVRAVRNSIAHPTPSFYQGETQGSERFSKELKVTQHAKAGKGQEKCITGSQLMPIPLHGYSRTATSLSAFPYQGPSSLIFEDIRPQDLKLAVEDAPWAMAPTWPCLPKVSSRAPGKVDPVAEGG